MYRITITHEETGEVVHDWPNVLPGHLTEAGSCEMKQMHDAIEQHALAIPNYKPYVPLADLVVGKSGCDLHEH